MRVIILLVLLSLGCSHPAPASKHRRSQTAIRHFKRQHPCPATGKPTGPCPGWVIDHVVPLACGGPDAPNNMQWQTKEAAKEKDKWERKGCTSGR